MMSLARLFNAFSQCGRDSCTSSNKTPPSPFRSCCFNSRNKLLPSFSLNTGLNANRVPSYDTSIFGLFCNASVCNHWKVNVQQIMNMTIFRPAQANGAYIFHGRPNVQLIGFIENVFDCERMVVTVQMARFHVFHNFGQHSESVLRTAGHGFVAGNDFIEFENHWVCCAVKWQIHR